MWKCGLELVDDLRARREEAEALVAQHLVKGRGHDTDHDVEKPAMSGLAGDHVRCQL